MKDWKIEENLSKIEEWLSEKDRLKHLLEEIVIPVILLTWNYCGHTWGHEFFLELEILQSAIRLWIAI